MGISNLALPDDEYLPAGFTEDFEISAVAYYLPRRLLATLARQACRGLTAEHTPLPTACRGREDTENGGNSFWQGEKFIKSRGKFFNIADLTFPDDEDFIAEFV